MIYIYTYNFRTNDMKFVWVGCISDHFCILKYDDTYIYIYIIFCSEQMTWQLHKFGCISDHFCVLQNTDICIYVSEQITWIGCMSDHVCILQNNDIYI